MKAKHIVIRVILLVLISLLSLALTMAVATLLFSMFMICKVDYPAWMFFVYALGSDRGKTCAAGLRGRFR